MTAAEQFARRMILDMLQTASAEWWLMRSAVFREVGTPTCDEIALACANHARFIREFDGLDQEADEQLLDLVLAELVAVPLTIGQELAA